MRNWENEKVAANKFELVLESENVGAWMAINNAFTFQWGDKPTAAGNRSLGNGDSYWNGILVQLGRFWRISDGNLMNGFERIEFHHNQELKGFLKKEDFARGVVWINIVCHQSNGREDPVRPHDFRERVKLGEVKASMIMDRAKPLHNYLQPFPGGITLWPETGYTIRATVGNGSLRHVSHAFEIDVPDPAALRVEVLLLASSDNGPRWHYPKTLRKDLKEKDPLDIGEWLICYGTGHNLQHQEQKGAEGPMSPVWTRNEVDRIVVIKSPADGGQQIGKNPPQA